MRRAMKSGAAAIPFCYLVKIPIYNNPDCFRGAEDLIDRIGVMSCTVAESMKTRCFGDGMNAVYLRRPIALRDQSRCGFTLLEVMVVVVILGILATLVVPKIISRPDDARIVAAKQDIASLMQALKLYRLDNQRYPTTEQGLQALVAKPDTQPSPPNWKTGGYVERLPKDPWGNAYRYLNPGVHGEIDISSFGADGVAGGEGNDADIGSWNI